MLRWGALFAHTPLDFGAIGFPPAIDSQYVPHLGAQLHSHLEDNLQCNLRVARLWVLWALPRAVVINSPHWTWTLLWPTRHVVRSPGIRLKCRTAFNNCCYGITNMDFYTATDQFGNLISLQPVLKSETSNAHTAHTAAHLENANGCSTYQENAMECKPGPVPLP